MPITMIQFREPVAVPGDTGAIDTWTPLKHGKAVPHVTVEGPYAVLQIHNGDVIKVPMSNIVAFTEKPETMKVAKLAGGNK